MPPNRTPFLNRRAEPQFVDGNCVTLLRDGAEAYPAMLAAIAGATEQVLFEMYWLGSDKAGHSFADALMAAARRGVEVALVYDAIGSLGIDGAFLEELRRAGCFVAEFGPLAPWRPRFRWEGLARRDHRKILIVDGEIGFTGGMNVADAWLPLDQGGQGWRDDMVRVEGPAVRGLVNCLFAAWRRAGGPPLGRTRRSDSGPPKKAEDQQVRVLGESYFRSRRQISTAYLQALHGASRTAWITNAYFVPDRSVRHALVGAVRRGVDVRVLMPAKSDVEVVRYASRGTWSRLLTRGVRLYEWLPSVLHAKSAVIDGHWSTVGTYNLDYLSLRSNLEVNVAVLDARFGAEMERSFLRDLEQSREVDLAGFRQRPPLDRVLEHVAYRFRKFL